MHYYWWRSNGESGNSGNVLSSSLGEAKKKVFKTFKETDIFIVLASRDVKKNKFEKGQYI